MLNHCTTLFMLFYNILVKFLYKILGTIYHVICVVLQFVFIRQVLSMVLSCAGIWLFMDCTGSANHSFQGS